MSRFREELKMIPRTAWVIAIVVYAGFLTLIVNFMVRQWQPFEILISIFIPLIFFAYVLLTGYVYGDARRRGMRRVLWALMVVLIPNAIGFVIYFIMREPLLTHCPHCGGLARLNFAYCPHCGRNMTPVCPKCRKGVEPGWSHCPQCGAPLDAPVSEPA